MLAQQLSTFSIAQFSDIRSRVHGNFVNGASMARGPPSFRIERVRGPRALAGTLKRRSAAPICSLTGLRGAAPRADGGATELPHISCRLSVVDHKKSPIRPRFYRFFGWDSSFSCFRMFSSHFIGEKYQEY